MNQPSDLERFLGYARAFELAYLSDDWTSIEPFFADAAFHHVVRGGPFGHGATGAAAVIADLRASVGRVDRRFDVRIPEILSGPTTRADGVVMNWRMVFRRAGLPDLRVEGDHRTVYAGGVIAEIHEQLAPGTADEVEKYLAEYGAALRPEGAAFALPRDPRDLDSIAAASARSLVRMYGHAKSEQDVGAALAVCSEDFALEATSLGLTARGKPAVRRSLDAFFAAFPDYAVRLDGFATGADGVAAWGEARMSLHGEWFGIAPTGKTAELSIFCVFGIAAGALTSERFFFDRATLAEQIGVPIAQLDEKLRAVRALAG